VPKEREAICLEFLGLIYSSILTIFVQENEYNFDIALTSLKTLAKIKRYLLQYKKAGL